MPVPHREQEDFNEKLRIYKVCLEKRYSLGWFAQRLLKRFIPYWDCSWAYNQKAFRRLIGDRIGKVDAVVSRYIRPVAAFKLWEIAPLYVDADDIHTFEFDAETRVVGNSLKRRLQRWLLARFQFRIYKLAKSIWVPAPEQLSLLPNYPLTCLPNISCRSLPDYSNLPGDENTLFFVGLMSSDPNRVAIGWFLSTYWVKLKEQFPKLKLRIVGDGLSTDLEKKWNAFPDVEILGWQVDADRYYKDSLALITPMQIGMGSCIKVRESLALGRCVISTAKGLRGIDPRDWISENGIFPFDDIVSLASSIRKLQDDQARVRAQCGGRQFVQSKFSFAVVKFVLGKVLR